jgi:hypothetical protein
MSFYFKTWWDFTVDPTKDSMKYCANLRKMRRTPWQWLDKRWGKKAWDLHGKYKQAGTDKDGAGGQQSQKHANHSFWQQGDCSQIIGPGRPNSQFRILLWRFTAKISPRTLATKELNVESRHLTVSHFHFHQKLSTKINMTVFFHLPTFLCFPVWRQNRKVAISTRLRWSRLNLRWCWTPL